MAAWHKLSCHERGVPEVGFRLVCMNNQPNHGPVRSQSPQEGPRARRGARRWSHVIGLRNARWGRGLVLVRRIGRAPASTRFTRTRTWTPPVGRWHPRKPARMCSSRRHGREGAKAAVQRAKSSRRSRYWVAGLGYHPTCHCHDRRPRSTRSSRGMAVFLASGASVCEVERLQRTRFFIGCRGNFDE